MRIVRHQHRRLVHMPLRIRLGKGEYQRHCAREKGTRYTCAECSDWSAMGRLPATMDSDRHGSGSIRFNRVQMQEVHTLTWQLNSPAAYTVGWVLQTIVLFAPANAARPALALIFPLTAVKAD